MRHSLALTHLESLWAITADAFDTMSCGPGAFAAIAGISPEELQDFFPEMEDRAWTNRKDMERALRSFGWQFQKVSGAWPRLGLCFVHWCGPWTDRDYPAAVLPHTHWIAIVGDYVFDVNWRGWLPKENWEEIVVSEILRHHDGATDWKSLVAYEILLN